jgi:hypothetical protein
MTVRGVIMTDLDLYTAIAIFIVSSLQILHRFTQETRLSRWLAPFSLGWILSGLVMVLPMVQKGSLLSVAAVYFLLGALILNTLVLFTCSQLPTRIVDFKSPTVEMMGGILLKLMGRGLCILCKDLLIALFRFIDTVIGVRPQPAQLNSCF